jgi:excisionase family DNA binding protein
MNGRFIPKGSEELRILLRQLEDLRHRRSFLSPAEVARRLAVHRATVYRWIHTGELPAVRLGEGGTTLRVRADTLNAWLTPTEGEHNDVA